MTELKQKKERWKNKNQNNLFLFLRLRNEIKQKGNEKAKDLLTWWELGHVTLTHELQHRLQEVTCVLYIFCPQRTILKKSFKK